MIEEANATVRGVLSAGAALAGLLVASGCCSPLASTPGRFQGKDPVSLLREVALPGDWDVDRNSAINRMQLNLESKVYRGVWAALDRAAGDGIVELYGVEEFPEYRAWFLFTTRSGRRVALFACEEWARELEDPGRIPSVDVPAPVMERLRTRVSADWPPPWTVELSSQASDCSYVLVHVYRDCVNSRALLYNPDFYYFDRLAPRRMAQYQVAFPVIHAIGAIQAAMPVDFFPDNDQSPKDTYGELKPY